MKQFLFSTCFFFLSFFLPAQDAPKGEVYAYGRAIVDTMTSRSMHGRGYVNNGTRIAANYVKSEFKKDGLLFWGEDYFQPFSFPVNTFPGEMFVMIDGKELECGRDYIVRGDCGTLKGEFDIVWVNVAALAKSKKQLKKLRKVFKSSPSSFAVIDPKGMDPKDDASQKLLKELKDNSLLGASGIIEIEETKLTGDFAMQEQSGIALIALRSSLDPAGKKIIVDIKNEQIRSYPSQNVIGYVKGSVYPDSFIVFSAHYDHLGQMGKNVYFPGANDNASGSAMLLNLATYYSSPAHPPKYSIAFMSFGAEEVGLIGSGYYTEHPLFPLKNISFLLNMDIMGTGEDGVTMVNGSVYRKEFDLLKEINDKNGYIKDVKIRGKAANSDHYFFSEKGVKAMFMYTMGGIKAYHDIYDRSETLPLNEFEDLFMLITKFGDALQSGAGK